jgi:hypothetical protein
MPGTGHDLIGSFLSSGVTCHTLTCNLPTHISIKNSFSFLFDLDRLIIDWYKEEINTEPQPAIRPADLSADRFDLFAG